MKKNTMKIALCGVMGALSVTILLMGFLFPFATYACPAIAAAFLLPVVYEFKEKTAFTLFVAVSFLGLMMVPDQELVFMYIFVFGLYTVIKMSVDRMKSKPLKLLAKFAYINISLAVVYSILLLIFPVAALVNEFSTYSMGFVVLLFAMFNLTFFLYDKAVEKILIIYVYRFRPKFIRR